MKQSPEGPSDHAGVVRVEIKTPAALEAGSMAQVHHRSPGKRSTVVLQLAAGGACALALLVNSPCLAQGRGGGQQPGPGMGWDGAGRMGPNDQRFIVMMIPHHEGAIAMADLALTRVKRPEIKELAKSIKASQTQENAQMRIWYRQWFGGDVPAWGGSYGRGVYSGWGGWMGGRGGMMGGPGRGMGMMGTDVEWLKNAPDFDRAFIEQMIPHHRMGVMMASMAQTNSQHPQLRAMQQAMVKAQSREIEQMTQWYRSWYGTP
ncbi:MULTISPECIES: DUF305 domain-containing protein [unclassified Synechococcus]|uniref:DUF305 domain-containing protein n=1 Tax=unclassified Synechococcus TaxID=2626047 RepID=UPI002AD593BF|nr:MULTISPECIES: DUF305 domain-containing protein [unclassified Synechococcus]